MEWAGHGKVVLAPDVDCAAWLALGKASRRRASSVRHEAWVVDEMFGEQGLSN